MSPISSHACIQYTIALHFEQSDSLLHILQQPSTGTSWQITDTSAVYLFICYCAKPYITDYSYRTAPLSLHINNVFFQGTPNLSIDIRYIKVNIKTLKCH